MKKNLKKEFNEIHEAYKFLLACRSFKLKYYNLDSSVINCST